MEVLGPERVFASQALFRERFWTTGLSLGLPGSPCPALSMWLLGDGKTEHKINFIFQRC